MQVFCTAFLYLQFGFEIFWQNNFGAKAAKKMLVKLTTDQPTIRPTIPERILVDVLSTQSRERCKKVTFLKCGHKSTLAVPKYFSSHFDEFKN